MLVTHIYLIIVSILMVTYTNAKLYSREIRSMRLRHQKSWVYLDRMRFAPGQVNINFWGSLQTPTVPSRGKYSLTLTIIPQRLWQKQIIQRCQNIKPIHNTAQIQTTKNQPTQIKQYITIPLNVQNSLTASSTLTFTILEQTTFYFILTDCNKILINQYFNQKSRIEIQLDLKSNGYNYGSDQTTYTWLIPGLISIYYCLIHLINKTSRQYQDTNWPVVIIKIILWSQLVALCFQYFGHFIYIVGKGNYYGFFGFLYLAISSFSQVMQLGLVTFCAFGWMTTYKVSDKEEMYYPIASVFGFIYIVLTLISKINDGQPQKTHLYDSIPTYINFVIKLIVLIIFLIGIFLLYTQNKKNKPFHTYILYLLIFGIFCFVTIPFFITIFVNNISKHNRWSISFNGVQIIKLIQIVIICWQAYDVNSVYRKFTIHGRSFMESQNKYL